eukprot:Em0433g2a
MNDVKSPLFRAAPPQSGIQSTQEFQASTSVINRDPNVQQSIATQQPTQFQNIAGPVQPSMETKLANHFTMYQEIPIQARNMYRILSKWHMQTFPHSHIQHLSTHSFMVETFCPHLSKQRKKKNEGNIAAARAKANISLGLNIAAVVFVVVVWSVVAIPVAVTVSAQTSAKSPHCYSAASSLYYCYQTTCYLYFHGLYYYSCYDSSSYSYSAASNYYSNGYYSTYYQCGLSYQLTCV